MTYRTRPASDEPAPGGWSGKQVIAGAIVLAVLAAAGWWIGRPWTRDECLAEAAKLPTPNGVQLAAQVCARKYGPPK